MIKEVRKKQKSSKGKFLIFIIVLIVIIILAFSYFKINLRLILGDELNIDLSPNEKVYSVINNQEVPIDFSLKLDRSPQCKSACQIELWGLSQEKQLLAISKNLDSGNSFNQTFRIKSPDKIRGQTYYQIKAKCQNIKTIICRSSQVWQSQSALLIFQNELSPINKEKEDLIYQNLNEFQNSLSQTAQNLENNNQLIEQLPPSWTEKDSLKFKRETIKTKLDQNQVLFETNLNYFKNYQFDSADITSASKIIESQNLLLAESGSVQKEILNLIFLRNQSQNLFDKILQNKEILNHWINDYQNESAGFSELNQFYNNLTILTKIKSHLKNEINHSETALTQEIKEFNQSFDDHLRFIQSQHDQRTYAANYLQFILSKTKNLTLVKKNFQCPYYLHQIQSLPKNIAANISKAKELAKQELVSNAEKYGKAIISNNTNPMDMKEKYIEYYSQIEIELTDSQKVIQSECLNKNASYDWSRFNWLKENISLLNLNLIVEPKNFTPIDLPKNLPRCCLFNNCSDCQNNPGNNYPIIFLHGHAVDKNNLPSASLNTFSMIQEKMQEDQILNAGELNLKELSPEAGIFNGINFPLTFRTTYYYLPHFRFGKYALAVQKSERIENYALRLKDLIEMVKQKTGKDKVMIVAHSMGGLVARDYLYLFGTNNVETVILINTPNHGIDGKIAEYCGVLGAKKECEDLQAGSPFLSVLNSAPLPEIKRIVISTSGCLMENDQMGDGIVALKSSFLDGAVNYQINGTCSGTLGTDLHSAILNPYQYPEVYRILREELKS